MKRIIVAVSALLLSASAFADEGMWMINAIDKALEKKMQERGLLLSANELYNADAPGTSLADAVVALDFACTGSVISDQGLIITNHHCAYSDVHSISTPEHNYLEDGFWALTSDQERPISGKSIFFLKRVIDVTEEAQQMRDSQGLEGKPMGMRKLSWQLEKKYKAETGLEASLSAMWSGSKYYMALYEVYTDVRLVAAPPVSIAAFGGDIDNWEWPQHKCDFAMYRIYTAPDGKPAGYNEKNIPLKPAKKLEISMDGYKDGDFTMVIGFPGITDRYCSAPELEYKKNIGLPMSNGIRGDQMAIISRWMGRDPLVRLKYSNYYFGLSNGQELYEGEVLCYNRFNVLDEKLAQEKELEEWIDADKDRKARLGGLVADINGRYSSVRELEKNKDLFRECIIRGSRMGIIATRISSIKDASKAGMTKKSIHKTLDELDLRVEKDLFRYCIEKYLSGLDPEYLGPFQKQMAEEYGTDYDALCNRLWDNSWLTDTRKLQEFLTTDVDIEKLKQDELIRFYTDVKIVAFNDKITEILGEKSLAAAGNEYTRALYEMNQDKGRVQYPDANSTMRITYGVVGGYEPKDGVWCDWKSTVGGVLAKHDPDDYDFCLKDDWKKLLEGQDPATVVDFLTDNDITGGNSGSPVLNARGQLIGLAFDGNKESLASDASFTEQYNKCVCTDIRYVLWTLKEYGRMDRIMEELGIR